MPVFSSSTISTSTTTPTSRIFSTTPTGSSSAIGISTRREHHLLPERVLVRPGGTQSVERIAVAFSRRCNPRLPLQGSAVGGLTAASQRRDSS